MEIFIRDVIDSDFEEIFKLASEVIVNNISPLRKNVNLDKVRKNYLNDLKLVRINLHERPNSYFFVANSEEGQLLGYILIATDVSESTTGIYQAWIFDLIVSEPYWSTDVPHKLVQKAEEVARKNGLRHIALQITCSNERALKFFKDLGYMEERKRMYKRLPFDYYDKERKNIAKALEIIKVKIKLPNLKG